jgi:hypothetical protein
MKLLTKELERRFAELGEQDIPNPIVVTRFFHPFSNWVWYATAYDPRHRMFFGWVKGDYPELGYFSLDEMMAIKVGGLGIERDLGWTEKHLDEVKDYIDFG